MTCNYFQQRFGKGLTPKKIRVFIWSHRLEIRSVCVSVDRQVCEFEDPITHRNQQLSFLPKDKLVLFEVTEWFEL